MMYDVNAHARLLKAIRTHACPPDKEFTASELCLVARHFAVIRNELEAAMDTWHLTSGGVGRYLAAVAGIVTVDHLQIKRRVAHKSGIYRVVKELNPQEGDARLLDSIHNAKGLHEFSAAELCRDAEQDEAIRAALEFVGLMKPTPIAVGRYLGTHKMTLGGLQLNRRLVRGRTRFWLTLNNPEERRVTIGREPLAAAQATATGQQIERP